MKLNLGEDRRMIYKANGIEFSLNSELEKYRYDSLLEKEPETIEWINRFGSCSRPLIFFDIGANIGIYSIYASIKYPTAAVFAFEPELKNFRTLSQNVVLNSLRIHPFRIALSDDETVSRLEVPDQRPGNSGAQVASGQDPTLSESGWQWVMATTLDKIVGLAEDLCPTHIKIDVDGLEPRILDGASRLLQSGRVVSWLIEFNTREEQDFWQAKFARAGYFPDRSIEDLPKHSSKRRELDPSNSARNVIFVRHEI